MSKSEKEKFVLKGVSLIVRPWASTKKQKQVYLDASKEVPTHELCIEVFGVEIVKPIRMKDELSSMELGGQSLEFNNHVGFISFDAFHVLVKEVVKLEKASK